jgi:hypothetical protein
MTGRAGNLAIRADARIGTRVEHSGAEQDTWGNRVGRAGRYSNSRDLGVMVRLISDTSRDNSLRI